MMMESTVNRWMVNPDEELVKQVQASEERARKVMKGCLKESSEIQQRLKKLERQHKELQKAHRDLQRGQGFSSPAGGRTGGNGGGGASPAHRRPSTSGDVFGSADPRRPSTFADARRPSTSAEAFGSAGSRQPRESADSLLSVPSQGRTEGRSPSRSPSANSSQVNSSQVQGGSQGQFSNGTARIGSQPGDSSASRSPRAQSSQLSCGSQGQFSNGAAAAGGDSAISSTAPVSSKIEDTARQQSGAHSGTATNTGQSRSQSGAHSGTATNIGDEDETGDVHYEVHDWGGEYFDIHIEKEEMESMDNELFEPLAAFDEDMTEMLIDIVNYKLRPILLLDPEKFQDGRLPYGLRPNKGDDGEVARLQEENAQLKHDKAAKEEEINRLKAIIASLRKSLKALETGQKSELPVVQEQAAEVEKIVEKIVEYQESKWNDENVHKAIEDAVEKATAPFKMRIQELEADLRKAQSEIDALKKEIAKLK